MGGTDRLTLSERLWRFGLRSCEPVLFFNYVIDCSKLTYSQNGCGLILEGTAKRMSETDAVKLRRRIQSLEEMRPWEIYHPKRRYNKQRESPENKICPRGGRPARWAERKEIGDGCLRLLKRKK